jgi:hypothetical protein
MAMGISIQLSTQHVTIFRIILLILQGACYLLHTVFLLGLFSDFEDGGDMVLQNVG